MTLKTLWKVSVTNRRRTFQHHALPRIISDFHLRRYGINDCPLTPCMERFSSFTFLRGHQICLRSSAQRYTTSCKNPPQMTHNLLTTMTLTFGVPSRSMYVSIAKSTSLTKAKFENSGKIIKKICICELKKCRH